MKPGIGGERQGCLFTSKTKQVLLSLSLSSRDLFAEGSNGADFDDVQVSQQQFSIEIFLDSLPHLDQKYFGNLAHDLKQV